MKISYINSLCVKNDAISNAISDEISWLINSGTSHEIRLFSFVCDRKGIDHIKVTGLSDVVSDKFFQESDLVVLHFGVYYSLFNVFPLIPKSAKKLVVFHNVTPKEFLPTSSHELIDRSVNQIANINFSDYVICDSKTNINVLREIGVTVPATVIPLSLKIDSAPPKNKPSFEDKTVRVAFVGRFVKSKGVVDLIEAISYVLKNEPAQNLKLDLVGNIIFSDLIVIDEIQVQIKKLKAKFGDRLDFTLHENASDFEKESVLLNADIFVLPTRHEGFCVPILEAFSCGCRVLSYNNSNVPDISGGLATLVDTGDIQCLSDGLLKDIRLVRSSNWIIGKYERYLEEALIYVAKFHPALVSRQFVDFVEGEFLKG